MGLGNDTIPPLKEPGPETLAGQGIEIANCPHISFGKESDLRGSGSTLSPRPFPIQGKGAALEDISPVAPWEVAQPGQPVKGAEHRRAAAALPLTGSPGCAMGGAATGDKSGRDSVDGTVKTGGGASGHDVQNTYKNTAPILLEAVLCVRLTAYYVISFLFPFVKRRYMIALEMSQNNVV